MGVRLPRLLAYDVDTPLPWLALERLPGDDLGLVIKTLSKAQQAIIAREVAHAQQVVARTPSSGRYGYAVQAAEAPYESWLAVVKASYSRSRQRIGQAGLYDIAVADRLREMISAKQSQLAEITATPFLHDTTTKNVIVGPSGAFSGIVDVDDLCFGDPRFPVALTWASLLASGDDLDYVVAWMEAIHGKADCVFRLYIALFLLDFMSEHGQSFNGNEKISNLKTRVSLLSLYEAQLTLAV